MRYTCHDNKEQWRRMPSFPHSPSGNSVIIIQDSQPATENEPRQRQALHTLNTHVKLLCQPQLPLLTSDGPTITVEKNVEYNLSKAIVCSHIRPSVELVAQSSAGQQSLNVGLRRDDDYAIPDGYLANSKNICLPEKVSTSVSELFQLFGRLPVSSNWAALRLPPLLIDEVKAKEENQPPHYIPLRRNEYLVKRPSRNAWEKEGNQCHCKPTPEDLSGKSGATTCCNDCICALLFNTCSKGCACQAGKSKQTVVCENRSFHHRPSAKTKIVKTESCGWGVVLCEKVKAGDFLVEYVGEVIDDATCEQRLWDLKANGETNFYMCEISRDCVVDASFKGNFSRFINHSCNPNCELQKWCVDGDMRVGIFALKDIPSGTPLTYDYKFIQFGEARRCLCGAVNCRGLLGSRPPVKIPILSSNGIERSNFQPLNLPSFPRKPRSPSSKRPRTVAPNLPVTDRTQFSKYSWQVHGIGERLNRENGRVTSNLGCNLGKRKRGEILEMGQGLTGRRLRIWWPLEQKYFSGVVEGYNKETGQHYVQYDDGDNEWLRLKREQWQLEREDLPPTGLISGSREGIVKRQDWSQLIGSRLRVWSSILHRFQYGVVIHVPLWSRPHVQVRYDNGTNVAIDLKKDRWQSVSKTRDDSPYNMIFV